MKYGSRGILALGLACLLLSACASQKTVNSPAPGKPNFRSIYYYILGSYHQSGGDYPTADVLLRRAADEDPRSQGIKRQVLYNSFDLWQYDLVSDAALLGEIADYKAKYALDEELLYALCDYYEQVEDPAAARSAVKELQTRFPSARADLRLFVNGLRGGDEPRLDLLEAAQIKGANDPATLQLLASIWFYYDHQKEKELLLLSHELDPNEESYAYLADYIIREGDLPLAREYFAGLSYPQDRDRMFYLTESAWVPERNPVLIELAEPLLATGDAELLNSLAYAALLGKRPDILEKISNSINALSGPSDAKQDIYAMLIAASILNQEAKPITDWLAKLEESGYFNAILSYYISGVDSSPIESWEVEDSALFPAFIARVRERFPDGPSARYLISLVTAIQDSSHTALPDDKLALVLHLRERHTLAEADYSFLTGYYHQNEDDELYYQTLREALRFYPDNAGYCNDLGYLMLMSLEDPEEAAKLIRHALVFEPDNIYYLDSLAWYHYLSGEYEEALKLSALPQEEPDLPAEIAWHIGAIYLALEDYPAARQWLERSIAIGNDPDSTTAAEKALKRIP